MLIYVYILLFCLSNYCVHSNIGLNENFDELTRNLIANLRVDPFLIGDASSSELSETSKEFIDEHIGRYSQLLLTSQQEELSRSKRSLAGNDGRAEKLNGVTDIIPYNGSSTSASTDIKLFHQNSQWYIVSLESSTNSTDSDLMKIKKYKEGEFLLIATTTIKNGVRLATFPLENSTLIVVAKNVTDKNHTTYVYQLNSQEQLKIVQKLEGSGYIDVAIWEDNGNVFMSLVGFMGNSPVSTSSATPRLYKWRGRHFDGLQDVRCGATRISPFSIGDAGFLAVANNAPADDGDAKDDVVHEEEEEEKGEEGGGGGRGGVYSEILKYNVNTEKYELFQKILTYGCNDIKYFEIDTVREIGGEGDAERFLVVANFYEKDSSGNINYNTVSIIYKYKDNYFFPFQSIRLRGVRQWEPIKNEHGNLLLIALTLDGIKTFQYDGWQFIETPINFNGRPMEGEEMLDVKAIHSYNFENKHLLVVARSNPSKDKSQMFEITFSTKNEVQRLHDDLLEWCQEKQKVVGSRDNYILGYSRREILDDDDDDDELNSESLTLLTDLEQLTTTVDQLNRKLSKTEQKLKDSLQSSKPHTIDKDINARQIFLKSTVRMESLVSKNINGVNVTDLQEDVVNVNENFEISSAVRIDFLNSETFVLAKTLNSHLLENIIYQNLEDNEFNNIIINGSALFKQKITILNSINNFTINQDALLLKSGNQNLANLRVSQIDADKVTTEAINGHKVDQIIIADSSDKTKTNIDGDESSSSTPKALKEKVKRFEEVKAENFIVGGFINDVDIPTLEKYALRKVGKQNITDTYFFDKVEAESLDTDRLSDVKIPDELAIINKHNLNIKKIAIFTKPVAAEDMVIAKHINNIPVNSRRELQVLLNNTSEEQRVIGIKTFDNLNLSHPINIQGKIKNKQFDKLNPMPNILKNLNLNKSVTITGQVTVKEMSKSSDVIYKEPIESKKVELPAVQRNVEINDENVTLSKNTKGNGTSAKDTKEKNKTDNELALHKKSMLRVVKHGLKLKERNIAIPIKFEEDVSSRNVEAKIINDMDVSNFVVEGTNKTQKITGMKIFLGNLKISGNTVVKQINGVKSIELTENVLKKNVDQNVLGEQFIKHVIVLGSLKSNNTQIGKHLWKDVITTRKNQTIDGNVTLNNMVATSVTVKNLHTDGHVNGVNFTELIQDAVPLNRHLKIFGTKTMETLNVTHLWLNNRFDVDEHIRALQDGNVELKDVNNLKSVVAKNVYFENTCNDVPKSRFETSTSSGRNDTISVHDQIEFDTITVLGSVYIQNNRLNDVDLEEFEENTVKIDEPYHLGNVDFGQKVIVNKKVTLQGQIENLDLENIFENGKKQRQTMPEKITFQNVTVNGNVHITGLLNNVNISDMCGILSGFKEPKKLIVEGNVHFVKGPKIKKFNNQDAKDIEDSIWFTDSPATLHGNNAFKGNVTLRDVLTVKGLLNDINVENLFNNYLSKTKDQKIVAHINLLNTTLFKRDLATPIMQVGGLVNDIKLDEFLKNTLLHRSQLFEDVLYLEEVTANHLEGNYLVNKLNLDSEVMRYDRSNLITGSKTFENLDVDVLRPERERETMTTTKPAKVQKVDVGQWLRGAVLKQGTFEIKGTKRFTKIVVNDTSIIGSFNGKKLDQDHVMMRNVDQHITGKKTFVSNSADGISFKGIKMKGHINGENFEKLLQNQAFKNEDNTFSSPLKFCNNLTVRSVTFEKRYSDIDVSDLLRNITTLGTLNHIKEKYKNLTDMADNVERSLKAQANFLDYYKPVSLNFPTNDLLPLKCADSRQRIVSFRNKTGLNILNFYDWDEKQEMFVNKSRDKNLGVYPNYINKMALQNQEHIYIEHKVELSPTTDNTHTGNFIACNKDREQVFGEFLTKGSQFVTSFQIVSEKLWCLLFVDFNFDINILCSRLMGFFHRHQIISNTNTVMASVVTVQDTVYLVTIHKGDEEKIDIWMLNKQKQFKVLQSIRGGAPISVSTIFTNHGTFLAVAYKHVPNTKEFGKVVVRKLDTDSKFFRMYQTIYVPSPTKVELALLPSEEIGLYVITKNPSEPLTAYLYSGVEGFKKKIGSPTIAEVVDIHTFSFKNQHFVILKHRNKVTVLQGLFKGTKIMDN